MSHILSYFSCLLRHYLKRTCKFKKQRIADGPYTLISRSMITKFHLIKKKLGIEKKHFILFLEVSTTITSNEISLKNRGKRVRDKRFHDF